MGLPGGSELRQAPCKRHAPILIVDGDEGHRALMASVLGDAGYLTREARAGDEGLQAARRERPSMVVLEVCLEGLSGYEVCRQLRDEFGDGLPVVFVSADRAESHDRVAGFLVGGDDFLVKPFARDEFVARVRRLLERAAGREEGRREPELESPLTGREVQVLTLVAEGLGRDEIARRLFISPKTVGTHLERIFKKLGVHTGTQAVSSAYQLGLLPSPSERRTPNGV